MPLTGLGSLGVPGAASGGLGSGRLIWPEGPLLERTAATVLGEAHDPQVAVLLTDGGAVTDLYPHHRSVTLDRDDLAGHVEHLVGAVPLVLPHPGYGRQADDRFPVRPCR
jgi:hypothetical protein